MLTTVRSNLITPSLSSGLADLENLRRRQVVELEKAKDFGIQKFSKDLITVADVLELAIENAPPGVSSSGADDVEVDPQLQNLFDGTYVSNDHVATTTSSLKRPPSRFLTHGSVSPEFCMSI